MTRPGKSSSGHALADLFADDAEAAILQVLRAAEKALVAGEVKDALQAAGVAKPEAVKAWTRVQKRLTSHEHVILQGTRYLWSHEPVPVTARVKVTKKATPAVVKDPTPAEALELLLKGKLAAPRKAALGEIVRKALEAGQDGPESAARRRQSEIDAARDLADLAGEVEELVANESEPKVLIRQIRARVKRSGLEPIDRAGEEVAFDRKLHKPIGRAINDGATVIVVRPGYIWKNGTEDVLMGKAIVEE